MLNITPNIPITHMRVYTVYVKSFACEKFANGPYFVLRQTFRQFLIPPIVRANLPPGSSELNTIGENFR